MTILEIIEALNKGFNGKVKSSITIPETEITDLVTDSRNHFIPETSLFFAINTPGGNDGHKFISELYEKGVRNFICQYIPENLRDNETTNFIIVPDSVKALAYIGKSHRKNAGEIVAITGSRGKTTLKELLFQLLESSEKISRSPRSYNSKIGVPLSLWNIEPDSDIAIIEAGISKKHEMEFLKETIEPDTVIFTNIGDAHNQGFGSMEEKALEKAILASGKNVKTIIYPSDDSQLNKVFKNFKSNTEIITVSKSDETSSLFISRNREGFRYKWKGEVHEIKATIKNDYELDNLSLALAYLLIKGFSHKDINSRFSSLQRINTRLNVSDGINGCSVILDSYTSDLSSLLPAIDFMNRRKMPWQSLTLIISDLHHEGKSVEETYKEIAKIIRETRISKFIGIGETFKSFASLFPKNALFFSDTESYLNDFSVSDFENEIILLKGSPEFHFEKIYQQLEAKKHETVLEVNLDSIVKNYNYFRSFIPSRTGIVAMVKASGYGAGSYEIAKTLQDAGAAYLAVAALDEGVDLRKNGIIMPIMVMNPKSANYKVLFNFNLQPVVYSMSMLKTFLKEAERFDSKDYPIHIKLDTGMHRMGFLEEEITELIELLKNSPRIKVESVFSHLATADCLDMDTYTFRQLDLFERMSARIIQGLNKDIKRHILNSAGILRFPEYHYDLVRLGIGLYGANTLPTSIEKPLAIVSTLRSVIICIREIEVDEAVGYSRRGKITKKGRIATIPIGYADGMNRKFGNGAIKVYINGNYAPTIGNICMDAMMVDVSDIECEEGDSVEIFGENVSLQSLADTLDTIPYEILTSVSPRVKRVYYRE